MIAKNWTKWTAAGAALLVLGAMPAIGQAKAYTGRTPASIASTHTSAKKATKLVVKKKKHKKVKKHKKTAATTHHAGSAKVKA